jgi:hypothetical protein
MVAGFRRLGDGDLPVRVKGVVAPVGAITIGLS